MPINRAPFNALVDDTGDGLSGSVWNKAAIQGVLLDPIDAAIVSGWQAVPFDVANFWSGVGAGYVLANAYVIVDGRTLLWQLNLAGAPAPTPAVSLLPFTVPTAVAGRVGNCYSACAWTLDAGVQLNAMVIGQSSTVVVGQKTTGANWTGPIYMYVTVIAQLS